MKLLAFWPIGGGRALFECAPEDLAANLAAHDGWSFRYLDGSPLANVAALADERVPLTATQFDSLYPGLDQPPA